MKSFLVNFLVLFGFAESIVLLASVDRRIDEVWVHILFGVAIVALLVGYEKLTHYIRFRHIRAQVMKNIHSYLSKTGQYHDD